MYIFIYAVRLMHVVSAGLTLRQNKHVFRASRGKGAPHESDHKAVYFISQIVGSITHRKCMKNEIKH
jgi:hypothetical protein